MPSDLRGVIGAPKSALRAFFLQRVKFIFIENHCKFIAICSISVLDTSECNKHVIQHPVWSVNALYMLFLSVKASHALFSQFTPLNALFWSAVNHIPVWNNKIKEHSKNLSLWFSNLSHTPHLDSKASGVEGAANLPQFESNPLDCRYNWPNIKSKTYKLWNAQHTFYVQQ